VILWFLFTRPYPKIPTTAPTRQQLLDVLWPEISKWISNSLVLKKYFEWQKTRVVMTQAPERWFATARTANKPENLAGFHEEHILFVVDEASGVKDEIFEVIEGALTTAGAKLLMCGNPTKTSGVFYDSFHSDRDMYWTAKVSCLDSPRVTIEYAERLARKYGKDSDVYRVRVLGEFPSKEPDVLIPLELVEQATMTDVTETDSHGIPRYIGPLEIGADIARYGDDEIVFIPRIGTHVFEPEIHHKLSVTETAGNLIRLGARLLEEHHRTVISIKIDVGSMGAGVVDILVDETKNLAGQWSIVPVNFGGAGDDEHDDLATIMWDNVRQLLNAHELHLPDDDELVGQLSTRKYRVTAKGKLRIERKDDYKKRHHISPDRADALVLCLYDGGVDTRQLLQTVKVKPVTSGIRTKRF